MESCGKDFLPNLWFMTGPLLKVWKEYCFALNWFGPFQQRETDVLQRRQEYRNRFTNHAIIHHFVFVDECGYNIWTARNHGSARQGERAASKDGTCPWP